MMRYLLLSVLLAFVAGCSSSPSPILPPKVLEPVKNTIKITKRWSKKIDRGANDNYLRLVPVVDGDMIYSVDFEGKVTAFNTKRMEEQWTLNLGAAGSSSLTYVDNNLYVGTSEGQVVAISAGEGKQLWRTQLKSEILAQPAVANGVVVARCVNGDVVALRQDNGKPIWQIEERTPSLTLRGNSVPVIYNDLLLVAFDNGKLKALSLRNGKQIWETVVSVPRGRSDLERMVDLDASPVIVNDVVYSIAYQGQLAAIQLGSGQIIWQRDIDSYLDFVVDAYRLYLVSSDGEVWALDRSNGATLWKQDALLRRGLTPPRILEDHIIVGDYNGYLHWLRRDTGKLDARVRMLDFSYRSPSLDESEDAAFPRSRNILAAPIVTGKQLIVIDRFGNTEAFEVSER